MPDTSGELVTTDGKVLGHHEGIHNFTVGQRKGLGVATGSPLYVININGAEGKVTVGGNDDLLSRTLIAHELNWIAVDGLHDSGTNANTPMRVTAKIRHRHEPAPAVLENAANGEVRVTFDEPQRAITPGQAVVFYQAIWLSAADGLPRRRDNPRHSQAITNIIHSAAQSADRRALLCAPENSWPTPPQRTETRLLRQRSLDHADQRRRACWKARA